MEHIVQLYTAIERCNFGEARQLILDGANVNYAIDNKTVNIQNIMFGQLVMQCLDKWVLNMRERTKCHTNSSLKHAKLEGQ
jgi:hypothetical protein